MTFVNWQDLAAEMSDISEQAYHAGWMNGLEYHLWEILRGSPRRYGQIALTDEQVGRLRELSDALAGWIWFNDESGVEEFVEIEQWRGLYETWARGFDAREK